MKKIIQTWLAVFLLSAMITASCNTPNDTDKTSSESSSTVHANADGTIITDTTRNITSGQGNDVGSDAAFILKSIEENMGEIKHSRLAKTKATNKDVRNLASAMIEDHTKMLTELKTLATKKQVTLPAVEAADEHEKKKSSMEKISGKQFEKTWVIEMLARHEMTMRENQDKANSTQDTDLKNLLNKSLPVIIMHRDILATLNKKLNH